MEAAAINTPASGEIHRIDWEKHEFKVPCKEIADRNDVANKWEKSEAYNDLIGFILAMNAAVKGKKLRDACHISKTTEKLLALLEKLDEWISDIPAIDQQQRFGNKAFRDWFDRLEQNKDDLVKDVIEEKMYPAVPELTAYLMDSFGNRTRIDYGTGHELAFVAFLCCLFKIEALKEVDSQAVVLKVFERYMELVRKLQTVYRMEPAGSHGVYSLDDYQFMPFLWGSGQLVDHPKIRPSAFPEPDYYESFYKDYMFLSAIKYICKVKSGPFAEHSNQLWNVSGVPFWSKVNSGLIKMYKAEVLGKFPVVQHFFFGSLLSIKPAT